MTDRSDSATSSSGLSERLRRALGYLLERDMSGAEDLGEEVRDGRKSWFVDELEQALRSHALSPDLYMKITGLSEDYEDEGWEWAMVDADMREVWRHTAPDRPFPWDDATVRPTALDQPDEDGVTSHLSYTIFELLRGFDSPSMVEVYLRDGVIPHVPRLLENNIRAGVFTSRVWHKLAYGYGVDPVAVTQDVVDRDLRTLWAVVYPDRPYLDEK